MNIYDYCEFAATEILGLRINHNLLTDGEEITLLVSRKEGQNFPAYFRPDQHYNHVRMLKEKVRDKLCIDMKKIAAASGCVCRVYNIEDPTKYSEVKSKNWKATNLVTLAALVGYYKTYETVE